MSLYQYLNHVAYMALHYVKTSCSYFLCILAAPIKGKCFEIQYSPKLQYFETLNLLTISNKILLCSIQDLFHCIRPLYISSTEDLNVIFWLVPLPLIYGKFHTCILIKSVLIFILQVIGG